MNLKAIIKKYGGEEYVPSEFEKILESKTFEEMMEGYKKALYLIKKIDKEGFNQIIKCIKFLKAKCPEKLKEYTELLKRFCEDQENSELEQEVCNFQFFDNELFENVNPLKFVFGISVYNITFYDWDMLDFEKHSGFLGNGEKNATYSIAPIFDEILDDLDDNIENGYPFYIKSKEIDIGNLDIENEKEYTLYKDKNGNLKVNIKHNGTGNEKSKNKTIRK